MLDKLLSERCQITRENYVNVSYYQSHSKPAFFEHNNPQHLMLNIETHSFRFKGSNLHLINCTLGHVTSQIQFNHLENVVISTYLEGSCKY